MSGTWWGRVTVAYHVWVEDLADPRTADWPLVKSPWNPILVGICYLYLSINARLLTEKMQTYRLKKFIIIYNSFMVLLSSYMAFEFVATAYLAGYSFLCQPVDFSTSPLSLRMAKVCWLYYFSKYVELTETAVFALRKKYNQISVLHVYHHTSMIIIWWLAVKFTAGGQAYIFGAINSFVHAVMYTYYGLSAFGPWMQKYLWWKKYITMLQLEPQCSSTSGVHNLSVIRGCIPDFYLTRGRQRDKLSISDRLKSQFVILFFYCIRSVATECGFAKWMCLFMIGYAVTLLTLFLNFYIRTYLSKDKVKQNGTVQNGIKKEN